MHGIFWKHAQLVPNVHLEGICLKFNMATVPKQMSSEGLMREFSCHQVTLQDFTNAFTPNSPSSWCVDTLDPSLSKANLIVIPIIIPTKCFFFQIPDIQCWTTYLWWLDLTTTPLILYRWRFDFATFLPISPISAISLSLPFVSLHFPPLTPWHQMNPPFKKHKNFLIWALFFTTVND